MRRASPHTPRNMLLLATPRRLMAAALAWLDRLPLSAVVSAAIFVGALGGAGFVYFDGLAVVLFWLAALGALGWIGYSAEPVFDEPLPAPSSPPAARSAKPPAAAKKPPAPRPVRDGQLDMVELPGGTFRMGSPDSDPEAQDDEKPQHMVRISSFRIATTPITVALYREVMGKPEKAAPGDERLPMSGVSWYDALEFCNRLSQRSGYRACYARAGEDWRCDWQADGYRLPSEAEWEYACRAGSTTRYCFADDAVHLGDYAWYRQNAGGKTHPVASKLPNAWGLYDMHGNVWEWCWDWYGPYAPEAGDDPRGPAKSPAGRRVLRGGSFFDSPAVLRSADRVLNLPEVRLRGDGFRCVRVPPQRSTD